jgi:hypothetical protein
MYRFLTTFIAVIFLLPMLAFAQSSGEAKMRFVMFAAEKKMQPPGYCHTEVSYETKMFPGNVESGIFTRAVNSIRKSKSAKNEDVKYDVSYAYIDPEEFVVIYSVKTDLCDGVKTEYHMFSTDNPDSIKGNIQRRVTSSLISDGYLSHKIEYMGQPFRVTEPSFWESAANSLKEFVEYLSPEEVDRARTDLEQQRSASLGQRG